MTDLKQLAVAVNGHEDWLMVSRDAFLDVCKNTVTDWTKVKGHAKEKELEDYELDYLYEVESDG